LGRGRCQVTPRNTLSRHPERCLLSSGPRVRADSGVRSARGADGTRKPGLDLGSNRGVTWGAYTDWETPTTRGWKIEPSGSRVMRHSRRRIRKPYSLSVHVILPDHGDS